MRGKGDAGKSSARALGDRNLCIAITLGVLLGAMAGVMQLRSTYSGGASSVGVEEDAMGGGDPNIGLRRKVEKLEEERKRILAAIAQAKDDRDKALGAVFGSVALDSAGGGPTWESVRVQAGLVGTVRQPTISPTFAPDESVNPDLAEFLKSVAINKELIVGLSSIHIKGMLGTWFSSIQRVGITNFLVIALDDATEVFCKENNVPVFRRRATLSTDGKEVSGNHGISGTKFNLLRDFLVLGYSVLLSDIDIVFLKNPFEGGYLHRDCDVEGMSDGFTNATAYGYNDVKDDPSMGWARYAHTMRVFVMNSGLFYIRPTAASIELLDRVRSRLTADKKAWDQAVFNEEMFFPSRPGYDGLYISKRILDYYNFMNSKVLFKEVRKKRQFANFVPVSIHVNYHPEKHSRMLAIVDYYVNGMKKALKKFPDGSM